MTEILEREAAVDTRTVHERMSAVLAEMPAIGKNQRNEQQNFMFRGHDDIMNALNPLLAKHGVLVIPDVLERVTGERTTSRGTTMYEVNLHVRYRFYGAAGDHVEASTWGEGTDMGDKATNKAMTAAFKNVLNQAFAISSAEFADPDGGTPEETNGAAPRQARQSKKAKLEQRLEELAAEADTVRELPAGSSFVEVLQRLGDNPDEQKLINVGLDLSDWLGQGCPDRFTDWESIKF